MEDKMIRMELEAFAGALASKAPTPGGGGASALCGALAAALGGMVCALTSGKAKFAPVQPELDRISDRAAQLRTELLALIDGDAEAFAPLARAYSLPKDAPDREEITEKCLADAAEAPMKILRCCCEVIGLMEELSPICSRLAVSDVGTGAVLAWGAMYGAAMNVLVNTKLMNNRERAEAMNAEVRELMGSYWQTADRVYEDIFSSLS